MSADNTNPHHHSVLSPDGRVEIRFTLQTGEASHRPAEGCAFYSVRYRGSDLLLDSQLGLELGGAPELLSCFSVESVDRHEHEDQWQPLYGEREIIPDGYREMVVALRETILPRRTLHLTFRAYNEGAAFCYTIPEQEDIGRFSITNERTRFVFLAGTVGYAEYGVEGVYEKLPVERVRNGCECPFTVEYPNDMVACLMEARLYDYARMQLSPWREGESVLVSNLRGSVVGRAPFTTPWRVLIVGDRPGDLVERNHLVLNLNPPCAIEDTSWIKPGRVIRDVTVSTDGGTACADFMADRGMEYLEFDAGWYGPEASVTSDAKSVDVSHRSTGGAAADPPELDLQRVIEYARGRGIGVWLYVNHQALERQMDELFPLYESWGVVGIKAGFVRMGPQEWSRWICDMVRKAAKHHLLVDIHDDYRPTGFSRTYPNLLTQEGIRGNEHMPTAGHNCTLPFTRYPAGAGDYTPCYYNERVKPTHAHQLALPVVFYSPAMFLFWYDRPSAYGGEPEIAFWECLPTVWDDTRVLDSVIGEYVTVARRSGDVWFAGSLTNEDGRILEIPLGFLDQNVTYDAELYSDAPPWNASRTHVLSEGRTVDAGVVVRAELPPGGGHAMRLSPRGHG